MRKILFAALALTFLSASSAWADDISGTWTLKMSGRQGEQTMDLIIQAEGGNLTVSTQHPMLGDMAGTGTLDGDAIKMTLTATGERKIGFAFEGTVTGNKMEGTREFVRPSGDQGGPPSGQAGAQGGQAGAQGGQAGAQGGQAGAQGGQGGPPGGQAGAQGGGQAFSNAWTAEKQ